MTLWKFKSQKILITSHWLLIHLFIVKGLWSSGHMKSLLRVQIFDFQMLAGIEIPNSYFQMLAGMPD